MTSLQQDNTVCKPGKMEWTLGSLGNVEIQIVLKRNWDEQILALVNQTPLKLLGVYLNNWGEGKSAEIEFDPGLFSEPISTGEEIFFRYQSENNFVLIILLPHRAVIYIHFRAWDTLESKLINLIEQLLTDYQLILSGFELDFDYDNENLQSAIDKLKADRFNYPFILKYFDDSEPIIFCDNEDPDQISLLGLLKAKIYPTLDVIS